MRQRTDATGGATEHRSALGEWTRVWQRPSEPLRGLVQGYTGYRQRLAAPASHRGIPGPSVPLVISFGPPQTIATPQGAAVTVGSFVAGIHDRHVLIDADAYHGIQVDLHPLGAYRLLGQPLRDLTGAVVPLDALFGADAERLVDDLAAAHSWHLRFRRLDGFFLDRLTSGMAAAREVARAWQRIASTRGNVRVADVAGELGWSQRHFAARFGETLGLAPKAMARLVRFDHAAALLAGPAADGLADIALAAGYYDQAHLANDVRAFSGLSPGQLRARRLPDDGGVFDLADI